MPLGGAMTLIDYVETDYIYPLPPIFETDAVLSLDLKGGPRPGGVKGPKGTEKDPVPDPLPKKSQEGSKKEGPGPGLPEAI